MKIKVMFLVQFILMLFLYSSSEEGFLSCYETRNITIFLVPGDTETKRIPQLTFLLKSLLETDYNQVWFFTSALGKIVQLTMTNVDHTIEIGKEVQEVVDWLKFTVYDEAKSVLEF